jgi:hypothetical protein
MAYSKYHGKIEERERMRRRILVVSLAYKLKLAKPISFAGMGVPVSEQKRLGQKYEYSIYSRLLKVVPSIATVTNIGVSRILKKVKIDKVPIPEGAFCVKESPNDRGVFRV